MNSKNLNWILHILSLAGILFLFLQNRQLKSTSGKTSAEHVASEGKEGRIAFFNSDSLLPKLEFFRKSEEEFKKKQEQYVNELKAKEQNLQKEFQRLQKNAENMTRNETEQAQKKLAMMDRELAEQRDKMSAQFASETAEFNEALHKKVISFLKEYNADGRFQYIFSVARDGNIFYSDPGLDITEDMTKGLNETYK